MCLTKIKPVYEVEKKNWNRRREGRVTEYFVYCEKTCDFFFNSQRPKQRDFLLTFSQAYSHQLK